MKHEWDEKCSTRMHTKRKGIQTNTQRHRCNVARLCLHWHTDAQTHKYTEWWQHCDRPWMITSWPLGPSLQISLSGSKSGLSLYANQPSFNRASQPQPPSLTTSSNHSSLANNALQNQHQALQETKEVRYHSEQERHELCGILSALCSICIQHDTR